jgi:hypothetical protein
MTSTATPSPDDHYDSTDCRLNFCEWLSPDSGTDIVLLASAQTASLGHVPAAVLTCTPAEYCEWVHNTLITDQRAYDALIDHLMECMQDEYQAEPGYWDDATLWAYDAMMDMADDWQQS